MADESKIINGFFRNIPISIDSGTVTGGRKVSVKQFPNRDTQIVEDLGLKPRSYSLEIVISDKADYDYFGYRNALIAALEDKEPTVLIHPMYGRIDNVKATTYSISERFSEFGISTVSVTFEVDGNRGIPVSAGNATSQVAADNAVVIAAVNLDIAENFSVSVGAPSNFEAAAGKVNEMIDYAKDATALIGEASDKINEHVALVGSLSAKVNSLVSAPIALADSITSIIESTAGLYASAEATFQTITGFFGFGDGETFVSRSTAGRIERADNNAVLNGAMNASALGYAYLSSTTISYATTRDIDATTLLLDLQYNEVQESGSSQEVKNALTDMRVRVLDVLDDVRVNTSQIISIETLPTSARLLSFNYYGSAETAQAIIDLNEISDVSFIDGSIEVLTS